MLDKSAIKISHNQIYKLKIKWWWWLQTDEYNRIKVGKGEIL